MILLSIALLGFASQLPGQSAGKPAHPMDILAPPADHPDAEAINLAQRWAFALVVSAKKQIEGGATDAMAIRRKATEDTQAEEKKLRAALKKKGETQQDIDKFIRTDRALYLEDVEADVNAFQKKQKK